MEKIKNISNLTIQSSPFRWSICCTSWSGKKFLPMKCIVFQQSNVFKKIHLYGGNFNTSSLYNQKVYVNHIKRSKAKGLGAIRPQRRKNFWLGKIFFSFLHEFGYSDSFAKISFFDLYEGHKAKIFHCLQNNFLFSI